MVNPNKKKNNGVIMFMAYGFFTLFTVLFAVSQQSYVE